MANDLKVGDMVRTKSGGRVMTIYNFGMNGIAFCRWHSGRGLEWGVYPLSSLVLALTDGPPACARNP